MSYQNVTGPLLASGYQKLGTQEAANGMYVVEKSLWNGAQTAPTLTSNNAGGGQRMPDKDNFNAVIEQMAVDAWNGSENEINGSLQAMASHNINSNNTCREGTVVRRLTPTECERLQGFPDGWTDIGDWVDSKGKKHKAADSPRYKALGNSIAVGYANNQSGFWMWLMKRISAQYTRSATLGSLFDGIGGFPLAWETYNGKGSAKWASEIEEFCIAVTKKHFPEEEE